MAVDGHGQRDHSWGVRDWWAFGWCWAAARLDDGTRVHFADIRMPGLPVAFGYLQPPGGPVHAGRVARGDRGAGRRGAPGPGQPRCSIPAASSWISSPSPSDPSCWSPPTDGPAGSLGPRPASWPGTVARAPAGSSGTSPTPRPARRTVASAACASPSTPSTDPADYRFVHQIRTRFAETDAMGIIHHGAYLPYLEEARAALLRHAGRPYDGGPGDRHRLRRARASTSATAGRSTSTRPWTSTWPWATSPGPPSRWGTCSRWAGETRSTAVTVHGAVDADGKPGRMPAWLAGVIDPATSSR